MNRKLTLSLAVGTGLSAAALYFAFRNVPLANLLTYIGSINYYWVLLSVVVALSTFVLRVFRWQIILNTTARIDFWPAFHPLMIGFMMNCVLPGRVGEVARPAILKKKSGYPFTSGLATVATERLFDSVLLLAFFGLVFALVRIDPALDITYGGYHLTGDTLKTVGRGLMQLILLLIVGIVLISINFTRKAVEQIIFWLPNLFFFAHRTFRQKVTRTVCTPLTQITQNIATGFTMLRDFRKIALCLILSVMIWGLSALAIYVMALGAPGIELSFLELSAVMIIICFFIAIPSVPGFWGLWEAGGIFALSLFGVSLSDAAGFTLANHAAQIIPVMLVGLISAIITGIDFWRVSIEKIPAIQPGV